METVIEGKLIRSERPGYPDHDVGAAAVDTWIAQARAAGVRTILCLLGEKQLAYYSRLGNGGLLGRYRDAGFAVVHRPVCDHMTPPVPADVLARIPSDFLEAKLPLLVHCSAGIDRTGAVVRHLTVDTQLPAFRSQVERTMLEHCGPRGEGHFRQVTRLALRLYDGLEGIHRLDPRFRVTLWAAGMLHDIGTAREAPPRGHAWRSGFMILELRDALRCGVAAVAAEDIATVAALHGIDDVEKADPLGNADRAASEPWSAGKVPRELQVLAGILRVADGLDRSLDQRVADLAVEDGVIRAIGKPRADISGNIGRANEKSALLRTLLGGAAPVGDLVVEGSAAGR